MILILLTGQRFVVADKIARPTSIRSARPRPMHDNRSRHIIYAIEGGKVPLKLSDYVRVERRRVDLLTGTLPSE